MAIDLLEGGLDRRTPRLYRHDMESFSWVLAYVTVAKITYEDCTINISPRPGVDAWFRDGDVNERHAHISSKKHFHSEYGLTQRVYGRYRRYLKTIQQIVQYWCDLHQFLKCKNLGEELDWSDSDSEQEVDALSDPEIDDPAGSLRSLIEEVEQSLGRTGTEEGF